MKAVIADMLKTAQAHEQWAMSAEATADEAATSTVFAIQIRAWVSVLELPQSVDAVDPHATVPGKLTTRA